MKQETKFNNILRTFDLELNQIQAVVDEELFYYLKTGTLSLFIKNITEKALDSKMRFVNEYTAPCLIPVPKKTDKKELVINATSKCEIDVISKDSLITDTKEEIEGVEELINDFIFLGIKDIGLIKPSTLPISYVEAVENTCKEDGYIHTHKIKDVKWLYVDKPSSLLNSISQPESYYVPMTRDYWFQLDKDSKFRIYSTSELLTTKNPVLEYLLNFWNHIFELDSLIVKVTNKNSLIQLYANKQSIEGTMLYSRNKLFEIINPKFNDDNPFSDSDPLVESLEQIGKYEKITFKKVTNSRSRYSHLDNILRVSEIRSKKVQLEGNWYKRNSGAFLAYSVADNDPIALIPKGQNSYIAYNHNKKSKEIVDKNNVGEFQNTAHAFFTPFPDKKITAKSMIMFGLQFAKKDLIYFFTLGIISALIALFIPISTGYIFNNVIPNSSIDDLTQIALILIILALSMGILDFAQAISVLRLEGILTYKLQSAIWDRILSLKVSFFQKYDAGNLAERSMGIDKIRTVLSGSVLDALISFIFSFFFLALLFYYSLDLALVGLALGLIIVTFTVIVSYIGFKHVMVIRYLDVVLSGFVYQVISGINKIRVTRSEERAFSQWVGRFAVQKKHYASKKKVNVAGAVFGSFFPIFSAIFIFIVVIHLIRTPTKNFTVGDYIAFNTAFLSFQGALLRMAMATVPLLTTKPLFNMFKPIIEAEMEYNNDNEDPGDLNGDISISNLSFRYAKNLPLIIKDISFRINAGEYVALVGGSGSGKSTLIRLLLGFEEADVGQIQYGDKSISKINIRELRSQISVVLQNEKLMAGTVLYNIIGNSTLTEDDAWEAAKKAGCYDDINELSDKMLTEVVAGGTTLSGGQVQRIIIASAFVKKNKIIIFDEATSALDNFTQKTVTNSMDSMSATKIVIAHRLSTVMKANRIIVMEKGKIAETGTYEELMKKDGYFTDLVKEQLV
jgi:NHLM bacteriocin system ABC transporter ATP-binding protein